MRKRRTKRPWRKSTRGSDRWQHQQGRQNNHLFLLCPTRPLREHLQDKAKRRSGQEGLSRKEKEGQGGNNNPSQQERELSCWIHWTRIRRSLHGRHYHVYLVRITMDFGLRPLVTY